MTKLIIPEVRVNQDLVAVSEQTENRKMIITDQQSLQTQMLMSKENLLDYIQENDHGFEPSHTSSNAK